MTIPYQSMEDAWDVERPETRREELHRLHVEAMAIIQRRVSADLVADLQGRKDRGYSEFQKPEPMLSSPVNSV